MLRIHNRAVDVGKDLEFVRTANVVTVARGTVAHDFLSSGVLADLAGLKRADHALLSHTADPVVGFNCHGGIVKPTRPRRPSIYCLGGLKTTRSGAL